jgi:hypothetical protein
MKPLPPFSPDLIEELDKSEGHLHNKITADTPYAKIMMLVARRQMIEALKLRVQKSNDLQAPVIKTNHKEN